MSNYSTIQQHEPLRTPSSWDANGKRFVAQLEEILDDIYRRFGRLRMEDLGEKLKKTIIEAEESIELIVNGETPVGALANTSVVINQEGIYLETGGEIILTSGTLFRVVSGRVEIQSSDEDSFIRFGGDYENPSFLVAPGGNMLAKSILADDIRMRDYGVFKTLTGSMADKIIVSRDAPDEHDVIWIKPNATSDKTYANPTNVSSSRGSSGGNQTITVSFRVSNSGSGISGNIKYGVKCSIKNAGNATGGTECYWRGTTITITDGNSTVVIDESKNQYIQKGDYITYDNINSPVAKNANLTNGSYLDVTAVFYLSKYINYNVNSTAYRVRCKSDAGSGQQACDIYYLP